MGSKQPGEISSFIKNVKKTFKPELMLLFGSRARKDHLKQSDYDFIVVSNSFKGTPFLTRIQQLIELWDLDTDVDILPYTLEEFEKKKNQIGLVKQALQEGIIL